MDFLDDDSEADFAAGLRELDGIWQEVQEYLGVPASVSVNLLDQILLLLRRESPIKVAWISILDVNFQNVIQFDLLLGGLELYSLQGLRGKIIEVKILGVKLEELVLQFGQVHHVVDQVVNHHGLVLYQLDVLKLRSKHLFVRFDRAP